MPTAVHFGARQRTRQSTTSTSFVDVTGASVASGEFVAGKKYLIVVSAIVDSTHAGDPPQAANEQHLVRMLHGATEFAGSFDQKEPASFSSAPSKQPYFWWTVWTAVNLEGLKMQFRREGQVAGTEVGVDDIEIRCLKLSDDFVENTDWFLSENFVSTTLTDAESTSNNAAVTVTPATAGDKWLVLSAAHHVIVDLSSANPYHSRLLRTGEATETLSEVIETGEATGSLFVLSQMAALTLGAASNTFTEKSLLTAAGTTEARDRSAVFALNLSKFQSAEISRTLAKTDLSATDFATQLASVSLTPAVMGDVWSMGYWVYDVEGTLDLTWALTRLQVDGADDPAGQTTDSQQIGEVEGAGDQVALVVQTVSSQTAALHTYDLDASTETALTGRGGLYRSLFAVTMELAAAIIGKVRLEARASGSAILTLGALGKAYPALRTSGAAGNPIAAAASARLEPRASGAIPLVLQAAGQPAPLGLRAGGAATLPIVAQLAAWLGRIPANGFAALGPLIFLIRAAQVRRRVLRLEVWTDLEYGGGICVGVLRAWHRGTLRHRKALNAESGWTVAVPGVPAFVEPDRILRIVYSDGSRLERLITDVDQMIALSGEISTTITAAHPIVELGLRGQIRSVDAAGRARTRFERSSLTGKELLSQFIVAEMAAAGYPYWAAGTVERDRLVRLTFDGSNPLDRLIALRDELGLEIVVRDDGVGLLYIDLVAATASERPTVPARYARNTGPATIRRRLMDQATVIYVRGMREVNDEPAQMGAARWRVRATLETGAPSYDVWLQDAGELGFGPLRLPGQLVGKLLTFRGAGHVERRIPVIADDVPSQSVRLDPAEAAPYFAELAADDLIGFLAADGTELTAVTVPGAEPLIATMDRPEIPSTNNPLRNAAMRHWLLDAAGQPLRPVGWRVTSDAGATLAKNVLPSFWETGGASALLGTKLENEGLRGDVTELEKGTAAFPFLSAFARFWPTVGQLYLLLELFDEVGDAYAWPIGLDDPWVAVNPERGAWQTVKLEVELDAAAAWWNERHPLAPIVQDFLAARLSLLQKGPVLAEAYVDRLQLTESREVLEFAEGSGPAQLWHAGNEALDDYMEAAESVTVDFKDLSTLGGGEIPPTAVDPGVRMAVRIPPLGLTRNTRVLAMDLDEDEPLNSSVTLAGRTDELTERLNRTQRFARTRLNA